MSATYTGVPGNITPASAVDITEPADGDGLNVASVNVALSELTDYTAFLKRATYDGTHSVKKLLVDGTGNQANANGNGTLVASGAIASTGGNITADTGNIVATAGYLGWATGYILKGTVTTADATVTNIITFTIPSNKACLLHGYVIGRKDDTTIGAYAKAVMASESGGLSNLPTAIEDLHVDMETDATWGGVDFVGDGANTNVYLRVQGKAATSIDWAATLIVTVIP